MRIAYILSMVQPGLVAWTQRELLALERRGVELCIFPVKYHPGPRMPKPGWYVDYWKIVGVLLAQITFVVCHPLQFFRFFITALRFNAVVEFMFAVYFAPHMLRQRVQRIHCQQADRKLYIGYFCHLITKLPLSVGVHAHEMYANPNPKLFPVALNACDVIVCIAELNRKKLMKEWGILEEKLKLVRLFGFADDRSKDPLVLLTVGRFEDKKGHDVLLKAVSSLIEEGWNIEIWIAGGPSPGYDSVDVLGLAKELGVSDRVAYFGEVEENVLRALYRKADVFCLLSRCHSGVPEGIPAVLIEAMSMGKPVISTRTGAIHELVKEVLIEEEDVDAAVVAIRKVISDKERRGAMGKKNREIVEAEFSEKNVDKLYALLKAGL